MSYPTKTTKLAFTLCSLFILAICINAQRQEKQGFLASEVYSITDPESRSARYALWIVVRVGHNDKIVDLTSDESGVIDLKLPVGDYTLISAAERDGTPLAFIHEQEMRFTIREGKTTKFGVGVIETKEQQDSKFGRLVAKLKFTDEGRSGAPSASKVKVRLQYGENFYTIPFNEFGIINEKLPTGKYTLVSASADGTPVLFAVGQANYAIVESGKDVEISIVIRNPNEYGPTDCEEARTIVDNAFYEIREEPEAKIEFVMHNGEADEKETSDKRKNSVAAFCGTRGFAEKCSFKRGGENTGLGSIDVNVRGELFGVIYFAKNKPAPCPNPKNWDVY